MLLYTGTFTGSIEAIIATYTINTILLIISLLWYVWEKARKDASRHKDLEILEAFTKSEASNGSSKPNTSVSDIDSSRRKKN